MMMIHFQLYNDFWNCFSFAELKPKYSNILIVTIIIESVKMNEHVKMAVGLHGTVQIIFVVFFQLCC